MRVGRWRTSVVVSLVSLPAVWLLGQIAPVVRRMRREAQWLTIRSRLASEHSAQPLAFISATHHTPLIRRLPGIDPQLQRNKVVNLRIAVGRLDGLLLKPGQRMSFWHEVGAPSYRRGFLDGLVLEHGRLSSGVGGGLCQLTNLIYWMTLHTPLEVVERWRHSYDVFPDCSRTQPFGSGATCAWPALDLQIENRGSETYRLSVWLTDSELHGAWTCDSAPTERYAVEEREHRFDHRGPGAYLRHNELWQLRLSDDGVTVRERRVAVNDALLMYEPFLAAASGQHAEASKSGGSGRLGEP